jgi:hypothetical protein
VNDKIPLTKQVDILVKFLEENTTSEVSPEAAEKVLSWIKDLPESGRTQRLMAAVRRTLKLSDGQILHAINGRPLDDSIEVIMPQSGWLYDYYKYTLNTEPPTVFHLFAGMVAIGSSLARDVLFDMGPYQIFPNLCVVLVAPTGRCRKTSACNMARDLYRAVGGNILADKITPEALTTALSTQTNATGLIYAPELAVFLGKQKYNEGLIPLLTALFDCPKEWSSKTIMRDEVHIFNVALSFLACSTMDWLQTAIPRDAFGGGFMSRLIFCVQNDTPRRFAHPPPLNKDLAASLKERLFTYTKMKGQFAIDADADEWYVKWYNERRDHKEEKQLAGYLERKADHIHRLAMVLNISNLDVERNTGLRLTLKDMQQALAILNWVERRLPRAFAEMSQTVIGEEIARMLKQINQRGGMVKHSDWLRLNSNRLSERQFKENIKTLRDSGMIGWDAAGRLYYTTPEGREK